MSSSGLIYAAIVGAWAAYLVPMWLRRQDELNEGRHTERFTTAIRILSRRGALERRYARMIANGDDSLAVSSVDLTPRDEKPRDEQPPPDPDPDPRGAEKAPPGAAASETSDAPARRRGDAHAAQGARARQVHASVDEDAARPGPPAGAFERSRANTPDDARSRRPGRHDEPGARRHDAAAGRGHAVESGKGHDTSEPSGAAETPQAAPNTPPGSDGSATSRRSGDEPDTPPARAPRGTAPGRPAPRPGTATAKRPAPSAAKRSDGRAQLLARRRRVVVGLFLAFTAGAVVTGMAGLAWLWLPLLPGIALTGYIAYLRGQERRRYEINLRNRLRSAPAIRPAPPRPLRKQAADTRRPGPQGGEAPAARRRPTDGSPSGPPRPPGQSRTSPERPSAPAPRARADRKAAEDLDHAEWIAALHTDPADVIGETDRDAWDPVPVPLPTYVTAPVVPRGEPSGVPERADPAGPEPDRAPAPRATPDAPRPTPLFDQYAEDPRRAHPYPDPDDLFDHDWPRAGNE
ncbi:hypothetical protein LO772_20555 [Yinghuangia sp. ASG 101]|uniref:divisome protein SepX/GlpR n=1 Tax=Yinghuangia sp. ASG 101 TaxID=2896848 RepID=UPI001E617F8E|nr:hypothetical protein [Yinghuangia sp. ASG 101]UGQ09331.1 hypothetical protein LO772_20555 [Yinghuangia sp. ASG 101]